MLLRLLVLLAPHVRLAILRERVSEKTEKEREREMRFFPLQREKERDYLGDLLFSRVGERLASRRGLRSLINDLTWLIEVK